MLSQVDPIILFSLLISFSFSLQHLSHSFFHAVSFLCLKPTDLCHCLCPPKQLHFVMFSACEYPSIHHHSEALCLSLDSPLLWLVSVVSVRTVIAAVTSLSKNKVVLCSWRHKRTKKKEPKPKRKDGKGRN